MPFEKAPRPTRIQDFVPDANYDRMMDLLEVSCGDHVLYIWSPVENVWAVDAALMPSSILQTYIEQRVSYPSSPGMRINEAKIGRPVLLSLAGFSWRNIWRSAHNVTAIKAVDRSRARATAFPIEQNR